MKRVIEPEWLDGLPADDVKAARSRRDLQRLNRIMGHDRIWQELLEPGPRSHAPKRLVELGAGDGTLLLRLAGRFPRRWPKMAVTLVDCKNAVADETLAGFAELGWRVEAVTADVFDWLKKPDEPADIMICNLFLHHFSAEGLTAMFRLASARTRLFAACEPRRAALPLLFSRMVGFIGCNAVTRHDAVASVRAGFASRELSALWPPAPQWQLREQGAGRFSHVFLAERISPDE